MEQVSLEAYEADKAILDTYGDSTILKRRREDDNQEGPSAGPNRGLTAAAKGKQPAKAKSPSDPLEVARIEAQQLKIVLKKSRQQTHISQLGGSGTDEGTRSKPGVLDVPSDESEEEISWNSSDDEGDDAQDKVDDDDEGDEETRNEESFDPIPLTPKSSEDEGNGERIKGRGIQATLDVEDSHVTLTSVHPDGQQESSEVFQNLPPFDSVFRIEDRLKSLEANFSEYIQTNPFAESVSNIPVAVDLSEMELKKILIEKMEGNKSIQRSDEQRNLYKALVDAYKADTIILDSYGETVILKRRRDDDDDQDEGPSAGSDRGSKRRREGKEPESASAPLETTTRSACRSTIGSKSRHVSANLASCPRKHSNMISELAKQVDSRSSFNELLDTSLDFSNFIMNRLRVDTLTPELLVGPTFELMKGSYTSLIELEYHLEEVYKATTDQLEWVKPKGQQYPHNLLQPLPLIPDNRGRHVIPFAHFINNDLKYLRGGASSRKYTTSVTKTKAADYGNIKWIEDLFYGFAVNQEFALDVYSKRRIIAVTDLKIVEWHSYKHLDWILVRRDDDKLYKFKECDFKRLRPQDIEDMLLLLIQGKLSNLTIEERFAFNRREAYTAYSNPRGLIYQNKDKKNRLMRIDELHKFSDGTLNDVYNALDDRLKGIRMQYLPQTIWRKGDKDKAAAMIQAIDKMLKTRRIIRSLERFVGGRLYEGDFWMLQRTI
nr:hypothetical protein [Tanacetum cinerariifolium]